MPIFSGSRVWDEFPDVVISARLGEASKHPDYADAKAGNIDAAERLVDAVLTQESADHLGKLIGGRPARIVPVHAEEASGRNKIPAATAVVLGERLGLAVDTAITQATRALRTSSDGLERLARQPDFTGVVESGANYVLVDDTLTQGGTFAQMKQFIEHGGGKVIAAFALTGKQYSAKLNPDVNTTAQLRNAYIAIEPWWKTEFGHNFDGLTESEARYILKSGLSADALRDRVAAARPTDGSGNTAATSGTAQNGDALQSVAHEQGVDESWRSGTSYSLQFR